MHNRTFILLQIHLFFGKEIAVRVQFILNLRKFYALYLVVLSNQQDVLIDE